MKDESCYSSMLLNQGLEDPSEPDSHPNVEMTAMQMNTNTSEHKEHSYCLLKGETRESKQVE